MKHLSQVSTSKPGPEIPGPKRLPKATVAANEFDESMMKPAPGLTERGVVDVAPQVPLPVPVPAPAPGPGPAPVQSPVQPAPLAPPTAYPSTHVPYQSAPLGSGSWQTHTPQGQYSPTHGAQPFLHPGAHSPSAQAQSSPPAPYPPAMGYAPQGGQFGVPNVGGAQVPPGTWACPAQPHHSTTGPR
eukprot:CAMPEP_0198329746 /NCGR_PEP_ID=MMETSP1450-20131203/16416_1 /TAXON_ID=753684 ORGANISM="Madagascaria erythrocladiodes, Strain CCMP3234" /NCGR_SAMPLE_ID=MMETSP1450 /ASSEMBLY_ACC=CAM_ASM_001115 /LENGTH=185 /DNA_ID=CAMNT_0044033993 /DNA_START=154 /DNA_END=711 /DNA_ORIENTATION=+